jgi:hypothetical protein
MAASRALKRVHLSQAYIPMTSLTTQYITHFWLSRWLMATFHSVLEFMLRKDELPNVRRNMCLHLQG